MTEDDLPMLSLPSNCSLPSTFLSPDSGEFFLVFLATLDYLGNRVRIDTASTGLPPTEGQFYANPDVPQQKREHTPCVLRVDFCAISAHRTYAPRLHST